MSPAEVGRLLEEERIMAVCTLGADGWPHVTPLWYVIRDSEPWIFTYGKSQKVRNLERDPRATLLVETGAAYDELRGVMLQANAEVHRDPNVVADVAQRLFARYGGEPRAGAAVLDKTRREAVASRVAKRVAVRFSVLRTVSWDHSKLGGGY